jgi:type VI secretion system protein ImpC
MSTDANQAVGQSTTTTTSEMSDFSSLLSKEFKPQSTQAKDAIENAVKTLAQQALEKAGVVSDDAIASITAMIAQIDKKLTEQVNLVLHHADFQQLESAWRGLHHLVTNTETDELLKIKVFNISKKELGKTLKKFKGTAWDQSPIFKRIYEEEYGQFGGEPYGCLTADYHFDHSPPDVALLTEMMQVCAAAHTPMITGAAPSVMQMESWQELSNPRDLTKIFSTPEYASWRSLRESED